MAQYKGTIFRSQTPEGNMVVDIVNEIFKYLTVEDAYNANMAGIGDKNSYCIRSDPARLFARIVPDPAEFHYILMVTDTIITDEVALGHMIPQLDSIFNRWTIVCSKDTVKRAMFMKWILANNFKYEHITVDGSDDEVSTSNELNFTVGYHNIRIINPGQTDNIAYAINTSISTDQCIISGYGIISPQSYVTRRYKYIRFNRAQYERSYFMEYRLGMSSVHSMSIDEAENIASVKRFPYQQHKYRNLLDSDSFTTSFSMRYFGMEKYSKLFHDHFDNLTSILWYEVGYNIDTIDMSHCFRRRRPLFVFEDKLLQSAMMLYVLALCEAGMIYLRSWLLDTQDSGHMIVKIRSIHDRRQTSQHIVVHEVVFVDDDLISCDNVTIRSWHTVSHRVYEDAILYFLRDQPYNAVLRALRDYIK